MGSPPIKPINPLVISTPRPTYVGGAKVKTVSLPGPPKTSAQPTNQDVLLAVNGLYQAIAQLSVNQQSMEVKLDALLKQGDYTSTCLPAGFNGLGAALKNMQDSIIAMMAIFAAKK